MTRFLITLYLLVVVFFPTILFADEPSQVKKEAHLDNLRDTRYCEILAIHWHFLKFKINVYSTVNVDSCSAHLWKKMDENKIKEQLDATMIKLNGPRYWTIDGITATKSSINTPLVTIGGMKFKQRATIEFYLWSNAISAGPYTQHRIHRHTIWIYNAGTAIYELIDPQGHTYVMQSYSHIINPPLHLADLIHLEKELTLPKGWKYQTYVLTQPLKLATNGTAYVIRDDLYNSYTLANVNIS